MKQHLHTVAPSTSVSQVARLMKTEQVGFLPVCDQPGHVLGVITDRDIVLRVCAEGLDPDSTPVSKVMTPEPVCCLPDDTVDHAQDLMMRRKTRRILLVDTEGTLAGLITLADVAQYQPPHQAARWLRELSSQRFRVER